MPKSKKPRKPYKAKKRAQYRLFFSFENKEGLKDAFATVQTIAEMSLPRGVCDESHVTQLRDFLNLGTSLIGVGHYVREDFEQEYGEEYAKCVNLFESYNHRAVTRGIYTATGDEINGIRRAIQIAGEVINAEFEHEPAFVLDCYLGTKRITDNVSGRKPFMLDKDLLNRQIRIAASQTIEGAARTLGV